MGDLRRPRQAGAPRPRGADRLRVGQAIRDEIARIVPLYTGVETLKRTGDSVQWGGTRLCEGGVFPTDDGRARFTAVAPVDPAVPDGAFRLSTRRGKQFNTMVYRDVDPLTGGDARRGVHLGVRRAPRARRRCVGARAFGARSAPWPVEGR